ncbi:hypothetical protein KAR91_22245 [Candidatus Pacearchaeota archaeon]|nr:hypothetical protein [Candidatus Pacearchaeota archaeon]
MPKVEPPICPYCKDLAKFVDSIVVYKRSYGMIWHCSPCDAYVRIKSNDDGRNEPAGRLANAELREWKQKAYRAFETVWRQAERKGRRGSAFKARLGGIKWLASVLKIPKEHCQIGFFDINMCKRVIKACEDKPR